MGSEPFGPLRPKCRTPRLLLYLDFNPTGLGQLRILIFRCDVNGDTASVPAMPPFTDFHSSSTATANCLLRFDYRVERTSAMIHQQQDGLLADARHGLPVLAHIAYRLMVDFLYHVAVRK